MRAAPETKFYDMGVRLASVALPLFDALVLPGSRQPSNYMRVSVVNFAPVCKEQVQPDRESPNPPILSYLRVIMVHTYIQMLA